MDERKNHTNITYDAIVIGAGICGIIFLKYALDKGLQCLVLEKQNDVGGLWNRLPVWQDIQNRIEDFAINDVPLDGAKQPAIHQHAREWVRRYKLTPHIRMNCEVTSVAWKNEKWQVNTNGEVFSANYLIAATGVQNKPWIPDIERSGSDVVEVHSSALSLPEDLQDKSVTIIGGGASSWDLLDLALENGAKDIRWVYRSRPLWFLPTTRSKQAAWPNLRELALVQASKSSTGLVNGFLQKLLRKKYDYFKLTDVEPATPFDVRKHQLIPGRSEMIQNFASISRHQSEVMRIQGREITLKTGDQFETDMILWATGYRMDLQYLGLPELSNINTLQELTPRLGSLIRSQDYPNLFFVGMSLIESTSSTPFFVAIEARSIVTHILGKCEIPLAHTPHQVTHWDLFRHFAEFDHASYPRFWWKIKYFLLAWWYKMFPNKNIKI